VKVKSSTEKSAVIRSEVTMDDGSVFLITDNYYDGEYDGEIEIFTLAPDGTPVAVEDSLREEVETAWLAFEGGS